MGAVASRGSSSRCRLALAEDCVHHLAQPGGASSLAVLGAHDAASLQVWADRFTARDARPQVEVHARESMRVHSTCDIGGTPGPAKKPSIMSAAVS